MNLVISTARRRPCSGERAYRLSQLPSWLWLFPLFAALLGAGCREGHDHHRGSSAGHHHHDPPHGGTGVTLGDEDFHIEFLREPEEGAMKSWILAAHMTGFVRIPAESFEVTARFNGKEETLVFKAVANTATGETVGNTSQFEAKADWLREAATFDAVLKEITIKGKVYQSVPFKFPEGN